MSADETRPPTREEVIAVVQAWRRENNPAIGPGWVPDCGYCVECLAVNVGLGEENRQLKRKLEEREPAESPADDLSRDELTALYVASGFGRPDSLDVVLEAAREKLNVRLSDRRGGGTT